MKFFADENFRGDILRKLLTELPELDIVRVQDTPLSGAKDEHLLAEAAKQGAVLITHDVQTITKHAYDRVRAGLPMPGVIEVTQDIPIGLAVADLVLLIGASTPADFENRVWFVPL
ncbi:MAG: DUF5615 family PIN-like protein [Anaerolineae bacterium]|nr:DUF5615 family PIN-like protein [Anaerolineae bacterium]